MYIESSPNPGQEPQAMADWLNEVSAVLEKEAEKTAESLQDGNTPNDSLKYNSGSRLFTHLHEESRVITVTEMEIRQIGGVTLRQSIIEPGVAKRIIIKTNGQERPVIGWVELDVFTEKGKRKEAELGEVEINIHADAMLQELDSELKNRLAA